MIEEEIYGTMEQQQQQNSDDPRIAELIIISSMYPTQLQCVDDEIQRSIDEQNFHRFNHSITALFNVDTMLEIHLIMPVEYPNDDPNCLQIYCRITDTSLLNDHKNLQKQLNERVKNEIIDSGSLINVIPKIIEIWTEMKSSKCDSNHSNAEKDDDDDKIDNNSCINRCWIYSHHIYSSIKRKSIIDLCRKHNLNGFMLIGKPGFICVEGSDNDCDQFWTTIRSWNWQRITMIDVEKMSKSQTQHLTFDSFVEHVDRSTVFRILEQKKCDEIIKNFLGIK
ncbi:RWD domain-containing protein 2B [Dermatophagoides farinae]|uniref:RWD domain-containing protein 2B n=1 Tax=Dermatophagoides farinae TaxID=6954 RepID=UPI003F5D8108